MLHFSLQERHEPNGEESRRARNDQKWGKITSEGRQNKSDLSGLVKKIPRFIWSCLRVGKSFRIPAKGDHQYFCFFSDVAQSPGDKYLTCKGFFWRQSVFLWCQAKWFPEIWQATYGCLETQENNLIQPQWKKSEAGLVYFVFWIG